MSFRKRLDRIERYFERYTERNARIDDMKRVIARMWARNEIILADRAKNLEFEERELSPEAKRLIEEDTEQSRWADQALWERYARANKTTDFAATEGRLYIPLEVRLNLYRAEEG